MTARRPVSRRRALALLASGAGGPALAQPAGSLLLASTTSTEQSGLFGHLLPAFSAATGIAIRVIAVGTGQALDIGRRGDADVLLVHDEEAELGFVAEGAGGPRHPVMYNDFLLVGPLADPAGLAGGRDVAAALRLVAATETPFVSRGDRSGTHAAELRLWQLAGLDPLAGRGRWYRELGQGMGPTLNTAAAMGAVTLTDRGTWLAFRNRGGMRVLVEGDGRLFNQYGVLMVNAARHPHVRAAEAAVFIAWLIGPEGQAAIAGYRINGEQLFFPNAR